MKDRELQQQVLNALQWEPSIEPTEIGVTVESGVVTLHGVVWAYGEKEIAERVALRVYGVRGVANEIRVQLPSGSERTDSDIAQAAVHAVELSAVVPADRITVSVHDGWLTLKGSVNWQYQKEAAVPWRSCEKRARSCCLGLPGSCGPSGELRTANAVWIPGCSSNRPRVAARPAYE
jgi:hypothetical protein